MLHTSTQYLGRPPLSIPQHIWQPSQNQGNSPLPAGRYPLSLAPQYTAAGSPSAHRAVTLYLLCPENRHRRCKRSNEYCALGILRLADGTHVGPLRKA